MHASHRFPTTMSRYRHRNPLSKNAKWGLGLGLVAATLAVLFWPKDASAADLPLPGPDPTGPGPGPGPAPIPGPIPTPGGGGGGKAPNAPPFTPVMTPVIQSNATAAVARWQAGQIKIPAGKDVEDHLTDVAMTATYPNAPSRIPGNWKTNEASWEPWVSAWLEMHSYVVATLP